MPTLRVPPVIAVVVAIGCNAYNPDLGPEPFLCGTSEPRCPDGYFCVQRVGENVCTREEVVGDAGSDGNLQCSGDALEPNDSIANPTIVPIPEAGEVHTLDAVVCPTTDVDLYRLNVDVTGKNVRLEVDLELTDGPVVIDLLNSTGVSIRTGTPNNAGDKLHADLINAAQGEYYARVQGMGELNTRYSVTFIVSEAALPP